MSADQNGTYKPCAAQDGDTGLFCLRERGHEPPHRCEIEWSDEDTADDREG